MSVGILGAAGAAGGELCRLLLGHPRVELIVPSSRGEEDFELVHPNLAGCGLAFVTPGSLLEQAGELDVVFLCTPAGEAMRLAPQLLEAGTRVIDLSADFRFADAEEYRQVYGARHHCPELLEQAACGITELHREHIRGARLVANPGCYVVAAVLALAPLVRHRALVEAGTIHLSATNGTSGAGSGLRHETAHASAFASVLPYSMDGHRHGPELEARLAELGGQRPSVVMSTAHGNFARGIYLHATVTPARERADALSREALLELYKGFYGEGVARERFVVVIDTMRSAGLNGKDYALYPRLGSVLGSNICQVGVDCEPRHRAIKAMAAIDNLGKGAAGSAVQNMNVMLGLDETAGLNHYGL